MPAMSSLVRIDRSWRDSLLVLLPALLLRLWHLFEYSSWPTFRVPLMDARYHTEWAERLATGGTDAISYFRAPFYAWVLAGCRMLGADLVWGPRWLQLLLGLGCVLLTHRIALRTTTRGFALFAGLLAGLLWLPVHHETELLLETLFSAQLLLLAYLATRTAACPGGSASLALGLVLGLAAITRPNALVWIPLLVWTIVAWPILTRARGARSRGEGGAQHEDASPFVARARGISCFALVCGFVLAIAPAWWHNARVGDPGTIIAWQGGINFYLGNNPAASGWSATAPGLRTDWQGGYEDAIRLAQEARGRTLRPSEVSSYWTARGIQFWRSDPGQAAALTLRKLRLFLSPWEIKNNEDPRFARSQLASLKFLPSGYGLWLPPSLVGAALLLRRGRRERWLVLAFVLYACSVVPFFVCSRYRVPVLYLLPIFAATFLEETWRAYGARTWRLLAALLVSTALLYPLLAYEPPGLRAGGFFQAHANLGDAWSELGDAPEAEREYRESVRENPRYVGAWNNLGLMLEKQSRIGEAEACYRRGLEVDSDYPTLLMNLALVLRAQERWAAADSAYLRLLELKPDAWDIRWAHARTLRDGGDRAAARAAYAELLRQKPDLGRAYLEAIDLAAADGDTASVRGLIARADARFPGEPEIASARRRLLPREVR